MSKKNFSFRYYRSLDRILFFFHLSFIVYIKNFVKTKWNIHKYRSKKFRCLEIGPGMNRIDGFETLNIIDGKNVDYIMNVSEELRFKDNQFDIIYASHVLEHIPWFLQNKVFSELYRVLKKDGVLEIWVPDGGKIMNVLYDYEKNGIDNTSNDGWYRLNKEKNIHSWVNGRIFSYGDESSNLNSFNWHRCFYTRMSLKDLFVRAGFENIENMDNSQVRGFDHGWINLGIKGVKK